MEKVSKELRDKYIPTIGLEIHMEQNTKTKMFCSCKNDPDAKPNEHTCPVCLGHPGTLPVINKQACYNIVKLGLALGCDIPKVASFDRKNYFYPDLPKAYQITQLFEPFCLNGSLPICLSDDEVKLIELERIHQEEDTGKSLHTNVKTSTLLDYNRAGVPLMELVTKPVLHNGKDVKNFGETLQLLLRTLNISDANMEKGQMRIEVNLSIIEKTLENEGKLGTKVEVKNINSFRAAEKAVEYEINRQILALENDEKIIQETRGWDDVNEKTVSQRTKEGSADYRYFPDPDLPEIKVHSTDDSLFNLDDIKATLPELPWELRKRLEGEYSLKGIKAVLFLNNKPLLDFFEKVVSELLSLSDKPKEEVINISYNYITSTLSGILTKNNLTIEEINLPTNHFAILLNYVLKDEISSNSAKKVIEIMIETKKDPEEIINENNLKQVVDMSAIESIVDTILKNNKKAVEEYKQGKENSIQFLMGMVMKESKGTANPQIVIKMLKDKLN